MVRTFEQLSARAHWQGVFQAVYTPKTQQRRGFEQKGDSFWGSRRCTLKLGKTAIPAGDTLTPKTQHWRGFPPDGAKS